MSLKDVPPEQIFWLGNGRSAKNLFELLKEIKNSDNSVFYSHVNNKKNDFYNWIRHSVKDYGLAKQLRYVKDKQNTIKIINDKLKYSGFPAFEPVKKLPLTKSIVKKQEPKPIIKTKPKKIIKKPKPKPIIKPKPKKIMKKPKPKPIIKPKPKKIMKKPKPKKIMKKPKPKKIIKKLKPKKTIKKLKQKPKKKTVKPKIIVKTVHKTVYRKSKPKIIYRKSKPKIVHKTVYKKSKPKLIYQKVKPRIIKKHILKEVPAHSPTEILSHLALGVVIGAAVMIVILMVV